MILNYFSCRLHRQVSNNKQQVKFFYNEKNLLNLKNLYFSYNGGGGYKLVGRGIPSSGHGKKRYANMPWQRTRIDFIIV